MAWLEAQEKALGRPLSIQKKKELLKPAFPG
jgi:hypothetical protein